MTKRYKTPIDPPAWIANVAETRGEKDFALLKSAIDLYTNETQALQAKGLGIADILLGLALDTETLSAAIAYPVVQAQNIHLDVITDIFGEGCNKLLNDVLQMQSMNKLQHLEQRGHLQTENLRKMLLAMVTDVRAVLIILAERLWSLRHAKTLDKTAQEKLAQETLDVYAPLANRLGVWQLKWEIEDLCLRYLQPESYITIAKSLASRRHEREEYIHNMINTLTEKLQQAQVKDAEVTGRVKHIYSIYKKMQRKNAKIEKIYDISALRVLVNTVDDCYAVLSLLQNNWQQVPEEFDDYIALPKPNGYRSIHTVILGPEGRYNEVQIRTYQMHQESELGVAAHWRYKEGVLQTSNYESKIALLRQIMAWQKEVVSQVDTKTHQPLQDLFADRIYVFTPTGDIMDLPQGATPLDFAYQIHSEVGHRCRGSKVNGNIVPLTHALQTGDRVEILTAKQPNPSRDWLNPHRGFLKTARARAKVQHWFRLKDSAQNTIEGREILDKELKKHGVNEKIDLHALALKLNYKTGDDVLAALGGGDIRIGQLLHHLLPQQHAVPTVHTQTETSNKKANVTIVGIDNMLTNLARCCKPLPGDAVIGYVTRARGVSIHRRDCGNVAHVIKNHHTRLIEVNWGEKKAQLHAVDLRLRIYDRAGLLRDITALLASEKINVLGLHTQKIQDSSEVDILLSIEILSAVQLQKAMTLLRQVPNVIDVRRR